MTSIWPRVRAFGSLRLVALVIGVAGFAFLWIQADGRFPEATVWQVPLLLQLLLLSLPWRTVSARTVARFFFIGVGPIFVATVVTQALLVASPLHEWLRDLSGDLALSNVGGLKDVHATVWAPITEEIWKIVPLLVLLRWGRSHLATQGGPLDFAILAAATGAGLGFAEDLFQLGGPDWTTPASPLLGLGVGTLYLALVVNPLNRFPLPVANFDLSYQGVVGIFDPSVEQLRLGAVWPGHGVLPLVVGLAIGFAVVGRARFGRFVYLLPALVLLWAIWDHFVANWYSFATCGHPDSPTLCGLAKVDLTGGLLPLVAIVGWALAMLVSQRTVARHQAEDPTISVSRQLSSKAYRESGGFWPIRLLRDLLHYLVLRSRSAFGWSTLSQAPADARAAVADSLVAVRLKAAVLAGRLRSEPVAELDSSTTEIVDRLVPRI